MSPEIRALLEREREIPPAPAMVRARALARARGALAAGVVTAPVPVRPAARMRWVAGLVLAFVASAAIGATVYEIRARLQPMPNVRPAERSPLEVSPPAAGVGAGAEADEQPAVEAPVANPRPRPSSVDAVRAELRLLRQARAAVAREDYAAAMLPIAEHERQFRHGRLIEEREALRVKALAGLGRSEEARRAAASFQLRFPHSVLSPAVNRMPVSPP